MGVAGGGEIDDQVVIPSSTPVTPPYDETEGLTSSSVVPPGSDPAHNHAHSTRPSTPSPRTGALAASVAGSGSESFAGTESEDGRRYDSSDAERDGEGSEEDGEREEDLMDGEDSEEDSDLLGGVGIPLGPVRVFLFLFFLSFLFLFLFLYFL